MKKVRLYNFEIEEMENAGCNNGNYPAWHGTLENGNKINGITCRCYNGCSGTDKLEFDGEKVYLVEYNA